MSCRFVAHLIIEPLQVELSAEIIGAVQEELKEGGLEAGMFFIGGITKVPDMLYLLWHLAGEVPVSTMICREEVANAANARTAAQDFLLKWNQRAG